MTAGAQTMLKVQGGFTIETAARVLATADPACQLDMRDCRFIDPVGLVATALLVESWGQPHTRWHPPADDAVTRYLSRMHLPETLEIQYCLPAKEILPITERDQRGYLYPLSMSSNSTPAAKIGGIVLDRLGSEGGQPISEVVWTCIVEAWQNILDHSQSRFGWAACQVLERNTSRQRIVIAIADPGVGLAGSLRARHPAVSAVRALELALSGVTSTGDPGRGRGLSSMRSTAAEELRGRFTLFSGDAGVLVTGNRQRNVQIPRAIPGTLVGVEIPCGVQ